MGTVRDQQLVAAFQASGDAEALEELVGRHAARVRGLIYPMVLNAHDADELTQEVFVRVVKGLPHFRRHASFSTWLFRIATNTTRSFLRHRARDPLEQRGELPEVAAAAPSASDDCMSREAEEVITRALATLKPPLRTAVTLLVLEGLSGKEAARVSSCPAATLYWRLHQARKILKDKLGELL